ncbi:NAD(P)/FAD-dependent oxidoreductase [Candidatus Hydrogenosomobacter endosymbioticus]|uniref:Ferredoxin--NADP reductase n=1 Tax=Candidatus Hydrogenosomobacter endosymbioticus TaxID=2558174 RepID=A0ABM7V8U7_9PROT|nr:NAD(P)/FAD-dependent oxidoreductase [Candidatus Hydrogenosomobacter endosymbioticus]BDB96210.1 ferredoxin--NADP reductase [Candidatus Hydrogenosomobacter endosymbioticus]
MELVDVAVIGAGPVGLFSVFSCGMMGLKCCVIESMDEVGGQCSELYPEKPICNLPGHQSILAKDLIVSVKGQIAQFSPIFVTGQRAVSLERDEAGERFIITASNGAIVSAMSVIIAVGAGAFSPRKLPAEGACKLEGKSLFYSIKDKKKFNGKRIVVIGGGDPVVDWSIALSHIASRVSVVHRRDTFRAYQGNIARMNDLVGRGKISVYTPFSVKEMFYDDEALSTKIILSRAGIVGEGGSSCNTIAIETDYALAFLGSESDMGEIKNWGLSMQRNKIEVSQATCETNVSGVYAVGDCALYDNKLTLLMTGFCESIQAAYSISKKIRPDTSSKKACFFS